MDYEIQLTWGGLNFARVYLRNLKGIDDATLKHGEFVRRFPPTEGWALELYEVPPKDRKLIRRDD